jgi:chemotaxis protein methyltransferase CheR
MDKVCTDRDFVALKKHIYSVTSLDCDQYKDPYLQRRFSVRMRVTQTHSYDDYVGFLKKTPSEYDELLRDLTINVTQFFRDIYVFKTIEEETMPLLIYDKVMKHKSTINVWSAGCSSGEEPYTLAIILRELLGEDIGSFKLKIIGTDIDEECMGSARAGSYLPRQMTNVPKPYLEKYFNFDGSNYQLCQEIMDMVEFKYLDLFKDSAGGNWDVILCRNVVIYFTKEMQERLYMNFYNALNEGGYFIMGNTESLVGEASHAFVQIKSRERIYQKMIAERGGYSPQPKCLT